MFWVSGKEIAAAHGKHQRRRGKGGPNKLTNKKESHAPRLRYTLGRGPERQNKPGKQKPSRGRS